MVGLSMAFALNHQRALAIEADEHEATEATMKSKLIDELVGELCNDSFSGLLAPSLGLTAMAGMACLVWLAARRHYGKILAEKIFERDIKLVNGRVELAEAQRLVVRRRNGIDLAHRQLRQSRANEKEASKRVRDLQKIQYILSKDLGRTKQRLHRMKEKEANMAAQRTRQEKKAHVEV